MRFAFAASFAAVLFAAPFLSAAAPTPAPLFRIPEMDKSIRLATPTPTSLTLYVLQTQPAFAPTTLVDFQLSGTKTNGKTTTQAIIVLPAGSASDTLEGWFSQKRVLTEVDVFVPPSTKNRFKNASIASFTENASGRQGTVQFTLSYQALEIINGAPK